LNGKKILSHSVECGIHTENAIIPTV